MFKQISSWFEKRKAAKEEKKAAEEAKRLKERDERFAAERKKATELNKQLSKLDKRLLLFCGAWNYEYKNITGLISYPKLEKFLGAKRPEIEKSVEKLKALGLMIGELGEKKLTPRLTDKGEWSDIVLSEEKEFENFESELLNVAHEIVKEIWHGAYKNEFGERYKFD